MRQTAEDNYFLGIMKISLATAIEGIFIAVLLPVVQSCNNDAERHRIKTIKVDVTQSEPIEIDTLRILHLESNDSSLLYNIEGLESRHNRFYVLSTDMLKVFDSNIGNYIGDISGKGQGPGEFSGLSQMWIDGDTVYLYDSRASKLILRSVENELLDEYHLFDNSDATAGVSTIITSRRNGDHYVINKFTDGTTSTNPVFSLYSSDWKHIRDISGREFQSGEFMKDRALYDSIDDRVLYWEALKDTVFEVTETEIYPLYSLDFGDNAVSSDISSQKSMFARITKFYADKENGGVSLARCYQRYGDYLIFSASSSNDRRFICLYNVKTGKTQVYEFKSKHSVYKPSTFIKVIGDNLMIAFVDTSNVESNPCIYVQPLAELVE